MIIFIASIIYSFPFYTTEIVMTQSPLNINSTVYSCQIVESWLKFVENCALLDIFLTSIIPFFAIMIVNLLIVYKLMRKLLNLSGKNSQTESQNFSRNNTNELEMNSLMNNSNTNSNTSCSLPKHSPTASNFKHIKNNFKKISISTLNAFSDSAVLRRKKSFKKTASKLFVITGLFLVLNSPVAFVKIRMILIDFHFFSDSSDKTIKEELTIKNQIFERVSFYISYLNYSLNFFLYAFNSHKAKAFIMKLL
jgi:hypothetical protein